MDLHFGDAEPSADEREAVDALLGPPASTWEGAADRTGGDLRWARRGRRVAGRRDLLLPGLHALNDRVGWISEGGLGYLCRRLEVPPAEGYGVATFYGMFALTPRPATVAHVCTDLACAVAGAPREALQGAVCHPSPCLGLCERAPAALVVRAGEGGPESARTRGAGEAAGSGELRGSERSGGLGGSEESAAGTVAAVPPQTAAGAAAPADRHATAVVAPATPEAVDLAVRAPHAVADEPSAAAAVPQAGDPGLVLLRRIGTVDPASLDDYRAQGGYAALRRAFELGPAGVIREVTDSGLLGRGGAAFPTGRKWQATAARPEQPHYLVCNADESEPGTFKDRVLMEGDPYALIEAMTIAGYAIGAHRGYLYLRGEYPRALHRLRHALARCRTRGLLGEDVLGQGYAFDIEIRRGAGAYICGEETALFNSLEGHRGEPRSKPPFPVERGLFGKPTAPNNVETLVNVLPVLGMGASSYAALGTGSSTGTKLYCVSGTVRRPGVYELPFGATLDELLDLAGCERERLRAVLLGGAAGGFVRPDELDLPLTFEGTRAAGTALGSGVVLVLDESVPLPLVLLRIAEFFRDESCGQCVPCRVGTVRQEEALRRIAERAGSDPHGTADDITLLRDVGQAMRDASICGLGQTAWNAVESALDRLGAYA
ncbi:NADH-ubiquinone oxidoreductase-F iron-sulfur binding region domain-containing protein [Streptomyces boncukensis]|uniref:NADH-quinone oxidoreductase subunit E n=1 Tax=Streptomyces boncukensis TaxID=2711219 RepID=A0A6G4WT86_9ACTN|nr:NADH-ubiquinone oxidoreductase-F iron-sulfur binding region domain-containing protein [Streptomyces boncukensis]NGO67691.1 NADH-quinone oxidoreductase subunit E [Streptomyces boncukensis]